jgi:hypothetical protein
MSRARRAIQTFALASIAGTAAFNLPEIGAQVTPYWATVVDDGGRADTGEFVALDPAGDAIVGGTSSGADGLDLRLTRIDTSGTVIWSRRFDLGGDALSIAGLVVDGTGDILAVCRVHGPAVSFFGSVTVKVSGAGTELWRAIYDTRDVNDWPAGIEVDAAGRSFVGGWTQLEERRPFIVSYDANGNLLWHDEYESGADQKKIYAMARDPIGGAVYLAGEAMTKWGDQSSLLLRYDADGRRRWVKRYSSRPNFAYAERVAVGPDGNVVLAGWFAQNIHVTMVDGAHGNALWSSAYGDPADDDHVLDLATDGFGNVLVSGWREPIVVGSASSFLLRYAPDGTLSWVVSDDRIDVPGALAVDSSGSTYVAGIGRFGFRLTRRWVTTRYDAMGQLVWTADYDVRPGPEDLALTPAGDVIVSGVVNGDVHVLSYRQP